MGNAHTGPLYALKNSPIPRFHTHIPSTAQGIAYLGRLFSRQSSPWLVQHVATAGRNADKSTSVYRRLVLYGYRSRRIHH